LFRVSITSLISGEDMRRRDLLKQTAIGVAGLYTPGLVAGNSGPFNDLATKLDGLVILPGDAKFASGRTLFNHSFERRPAVIAQVASNDDVLRCLEYAVARSLPLAVRCSGHSAAGHSVCDDGLVIDLSALNVVRVDGARKVVSVGGGCRAINVAYGISGHGLTTPLSGCPDVGMGGLTLGGGQHGRAGKYGYICDNVVGAELVTANGKVLYVSEDEYPDLFWAIRGGGGNFGTVTRFEYQCYEEEEVLFGLFNFPVTDARNAMLRYRELLHKAPVELHTIAGLGGFDGGSAFTVMLIHSGEAESAAKELDRWTATLKPKQQRVTRTVLTPSVSEAPGKRFGANVFFPELVDQIVDLLADAFQAAPSDSSAMWGRVHGKAAFPELDNACPLRGEGFSFTTGVRWNEDSERRSAMAWSDGLHAELMPFARGAYINSMTADDPDSVKWAYADKYNRLARIKSAYDPDNLFQLNHNIKPESG